MKNVMNERMCMHMYDFNKFITRATAVLKRL